MARLLDFFSPVFSFGLELDGAHAVASSRLKSITQ